VSNHGGPPADHCRAAIDLLPEIASHGARKGAVVIDAAFSAGADV